MSRAPRVYMVTSHHCVTCHDAAGPRVGQLLPATGRGSPHPPRRPGHGTLHCSSSAGETADIGHGAICSLSPLSLRFRDLDKLTLIAAKIPHSTLLKPTVNNTQDKPKSLRMCRVFSWIGWLPSFNLSLQGKWICCKPFLFTLLCWLVPGFVFLFFVGRKIFGCSISCSSSDGAEMETAASSRPGTKLGDLMDLQLKMSFAIFFGLRSEKSGRWLCF